MIEEIQQDELPLDCPFIKNKNINLSLFFQFKCKEIELIKNMRTKDQQLNSMISNMRELTKNNKDIELHNNWKLDYNLVKQNINRDYIFIAHLKDDVKRFNKEIREFLNPQAREIEIGDKIRLTKFYSGYDKETQKQSFLGNGTRYTVKYFHRETKKLVYVLSDEFIEIQVFYIELDDNTVIYKVCDEDKDNFERYKKFNNNVIKRLRIDDKRIPYMEKSSNKIS